MSAIPEALRLIFLPIGLYGDLGRVSQPTSLIRVRVGFHIIFAATAFASAVVLNRFTESDIGLIVSGGALGLYSFSLLMGIATLAYRAARPCKVCKRGKAVPTAKQWTCPHCASTYDDVSSTAQPWGTV